MEGDYKEVFFCEYCAKCEHSDLGEEEEPCAECLNNPANVDSHKPINFKERSSHNGNKGQRRKNKVCKRRGS